MLLLAVRQLLGKIVKDIQCDQLERIGLSEGRLGFSFELSHLELNETFINKEILDVPVEGTSSAQSCASASLRLVRGHVNSISGDFALDPKGQRIIEIDGLQLVLDVIPKTECSVPTARRSRSASHMRETRGRHSCEKTAHSSKNAWDDENSGADEDTIYSSLFMSNTLRKGVEESVVRPALSEAGYSAGPSSPSRHIDEGLDVFERTIRQFAHSVRGRIRNVSIILRIPPLGERIVSGREPPDGSLELLIVFEGGFELEDMCSDPDGDLVHKRIRFSGVRAAVYPYGQRCTTRATDEEVEESVDLADVFLCGGRTDEFNNDIVLRFSEGRNQLQGAEAFLDLKVTMKSFFFILSPTQIGRLMHVARALVGAPEGDYTDAEAEAAAAAAAAAAASRVVRFITTMKATCQYVFCVFLPEEDRQGIKEFWKTLQQGDTEASAGDALLSSRRHRLVLHRLLRRTGYYNVHIGGIMLLVQPVTASTSRFEDAFHDVFENHGGRGCSAGISTFEVYELAPDSSDEGHPSDTEGGRLILTTKENVENHSERRYRIAIVARTTHPLTLSEARCYSDNLLKEQDNVAAVVMEHVLVKTSGAVLVAELDAGILKRLVTFWACLSHIISMSPGTSRPSQQQQQTTDISVLSSPAFSAQRQGSREDLDCLERPLGEGQFTQLLLEQLTGEGSVGCSQETQVTTPYALLRFFTLQLEGLTLEVRFPSSKAPDPDYYGPLTKRLWEQLRKEAEAAAAFTTDQASFFGVDGPYLPLTMSVYLKALDVSLGSEGVLEVFLNEGQLTLHDYKECVQSNIIRCVFDTHKEPCIVVRQRQTQTSDIKWSVAGKAHAPFTEAHEEEETQAENNSLIAVVANISQIHAQLHQDEYLLVFFYLDQVLEVVDAMCRVINAPYKGGTSNDYASLEETAEGFASALSGTSITVEDPLQYSNTEYDPITTSISIRLGVEKGTMRLWAPRLSSAGCSIGDPLWRCLPRQERRGIDKEHLYHLYDVTVSKAFVFVFHQASMRLAKTALHGRAFDFCLQERLCQAKMTYAEFPWPAEHASSPKWGGVATLLQSYSALYNRSHNIRVRPPGASSTESSRTRHAVGISLCRHRNVEDHTEAYNVALHLDRISVLHQAAHEGDHWLLVLLNYLSDPSNDGLNAAVAEKEVLEAAQVNERKEAQSDEGVAIVTSADINITLRDILVEYRPFGKPSMLVCLAPRLKATVFVPSLPNEATSVKLYLEKEHISVFLHDNFQQYLLDYDQEAGLGSLFGSSESGVATDLKNIGFVLVLDIASSGGNKNRGVDEERGVDACKNGVPNVAVFVNPTAEKPVLVEVQKLRGSMFFAYDSLYYFRTVVSHFLGGADLAYLPSPHLLVERSGSWFNCIIRSKSVNKGKHASVMCHLAPDYVHRLRRLLDQSVLDIGPVATVGTDGDEEVLKAGPPEGMLISHSFGDFDIIDVNELDTPPAPAWGTRENEPINLMGCSKYTNFLSVYGARCGGLPGYVQNQRCVTRSLPPNSAVAVEICLYDCDVIAHLYGGEDFIHFDVPQSYLHTIQRFGNMEDRAQESSVLWSGMSSDVELNKGRREGWRSGFHGVGRRQDEYVVARFTGIRLQVDMFVPGNTNFMQIYLSVRDSEVVDCIEKSLVRTLFMASLPHSLRDHNGDLFELKWTTVVPRSSSRNTGIVVVGKPEEQLIVRLQPVTLAVHRRAMNLLAKFIGDPENLPCDNDDLDEVTSQVLFFSKIVVFPVQLTLYVYFEGGDVSQATCMNKFELGNFILPSIERAQVQVPFMLVTACPLQSVGERILSLMRDQLLNFNGLFMLLCAVQPLQLAFNVGSAGKEILFAPLCEYRRNKRFFSALSTALRMFLFTVVSQSLNSAVAVSRRVQCTTSSMITSLLPGSELSPVPRGSQPVGLLEGLQRGFAEFLQGLRLASNVTAYCLGPHGSPVRLPLAAPVVIDGLMRGTVEVMCGARNMIAPELYWHEKKLFKGKRRKNAL
ncbi:hypothetical protein TraAM80_04025 [Trypanosoma rangeli]|uniref:Autophagy-related protein 2 n=1 Tax=Trypanosoma rangeli TaxID=5698 RepID=A0A422NMB8_TRYRA|nr:uncharacterized protein TraAM80_04025 [Trypanosoma rangeli]RNF06519.1 hypothetical protein TraAM80_04025 [Trypanosoma rangeli]|eukprot:RNF06519.1 hypothetical protein TraAM80_04025 [Trypanosoma rangeli]